MQIRTTANRTTSNGPGQHGGGRNSWALLGLEPTLDASLARVFGSAPPSGAAPSGQILIGIPATDDKQVTVGVQLNAQAKMHYDRMLQAQRDGDWARFGEELKQLGSVIERLANQR